MVFWVTMLTVQSDISGITQNVMSELQWYVMEGVQGGKRNKWLNFDGVPDPHADCPIVNSPITQQVMSKFLWNFQDSSAMI